MPRQNDKLYSGAEQIVRPYDVKLNFKNDEVRMYDMRTKESFTFDMNSLEVFEDFVFAPVAATFYLYKVVFDSKNQFKKRYVSGEYSLKTDKFAIYEETKKARGSLSEVSNSNTLSGHGSFIEKIGLSKGMILYCYEVASGLIYQMTFTASGKNAFYKFVDRLNEEYNLRFFVGGKYSPDFAVRNYVAKAENDKWSSSHIPSFEYIDLSDNQDFDNSGFFNASLAIAKYFNSKGLFILKKFWDLHGKEGKSIVTIKDAKADDISVQSDDGEEMEDLEDVENPIYPDFDTAIDHDPENLKSV